MAVVLLDVVLGYGAHPDPAAELAPAIVSARTEAEKAGRHLEVIAVVVGTDEDPQDTAAQMEQLQAAGARIETRNDTAVRYAGRLLQALHPQSQIPNLVAERSEQHTQYPIPNTQSPTSNLQPVNLAVLHQPLAAINVGLESFTESLLAQDAPVIHVDWRPPAGGDEKLMSILERMR